jgi:AcrR family transcriptional regulator
MAVNPEEDRKTIPTRVKNASLVEEKRALLVAAAVELFISKGFHQATTRQIARAAGFSIGTLYEYISSKEDVLYLVCESIHSEMETQLRKALDVEGSEETALSGAIAAYLHVCDRMQDSILLIYRETASLKAESQGYVLKNEARITAIFEELIRAGVAGGVFSMGSDKSIQLMAHNVTVLGHMWAFRRWFLKDVFTIEEFIEHQTSLIMGELVAQ